MDLMAMFRRPDALRTPNALESARICTTIQRMPSSDLALIAANDLSAMVVEAIRSRKDGGILQIGMAPSDVEIEGERFAARCDLRLSTPGSRLEVRIEGRFGSDGEVVPDGATLLQDLGAPGRIAA